MRHETIVGINSTRRGAYLEQEVRHADCRLVVTDRTGLELLDGLDIGVERSRFLLVDGEEYAGQVAAGGLSLVSRCSGRGTRLRRGPRCPRL